MSQDMLNIVLRYLIVSSTGDIILGVNGHPVQSLDGLGAMLDGHPERVSIFFIPVGRNLQVSALDPKSEVRVHRARQLYKKVGHMHKSKFCLLIHYNVINK